MNSLTPAWHAIWTHSHCEQLVHDQLAAKGFETFLPKTPVWSRRNGRQRQLQRPLFPGYLFVQHVLDKQSHVEILKARGVVRVLGERWDAPARIPAEEVAAIRQLVRAEAPLLPYRYLPFGSRVRISDGPLEGVEGVLIRSKPQKGLLVVSIHLLQRSVAVEVDCTLIEAVA
jgi:transcription termination/antitermination protein NusG